MTEAPRASPSIGAGRFLGPERVRQLLVGHAGQTLDDDRVIAIERELDLAGIAGGDFDTEDAE